MSLSRRRASIVLLSGRVCSGKSSLAKEIADRHGGLILGTSDLLAAIGQGVLHNRAALKRAGDAKDRETAGRWVANALARYLEETGHDLDRGPIVLDSVRICGQVHAVRDLYGPRVHHIHLAAALGELERRFVERNRESDVGTSYAKVAAGRTERRVDDLSRLADAVIETDRCSSRSVHVRAAAVLGLHSGSPERLVDVLVGGQYGSEGKGNIVGHIAPEYDLLVRVGGPNAGHSVFGDPVEKYFHLPSGTQRAAGASLLLGAGAVIRLEKLLREINEHRVDVSRLRIDGNAAIISDSDIALETRILAKISSTAQGVGAASARKILRRTPEASRRSLLARDVPELAAYIVDAQDVLEKAYGQGRRILLEGTQGTSLSLHHGPYPYVTSRDTTVAGCLADAGIAPTRVRKVVMVCRTYPIRVGGPSGDMEKQIDWQRVSDRSGIPELELRGKERTTTTDRERRVSEFDWMQLRRSALLNGPTDIALTFLDYLGVKNRTAYRMDQLTDEAVRFVEEVERVAGVPASLLSTAFSWRNVIDRRNW